MTTVVGTTKAQFFDSNGTPLAGGSVYSYITNTVTPLSTFPTIADAVAGTNANTNPVILDSRGEANIVLSGATTLVIKDSSGNTIDTINDLDNIATNITDSTGNYILILSSAASAVNEITITNAATGNGPSIRATGDDNNVALTLASKGSSNLVLDGGTSGNVLVNSNSSGSITLDGATAVNGTLTNSGTSALTTITNTTLTSTTSNITTANITTDNVTTLNVSGNSTLTGNLSVGGSLTLSQSETVGFNFLPAGSVLPYGGSSAPTGWLICDGSAVNRTTYSALFAILSTTFGSGDGSTTFNLPDCRRRAVVGAGGSTAGGLSNTVGSTGGAETITISTSNLPTSVHYGTAISYTSAWVGGGISDLVYDPSGNLWAAGGGSTTINQRPPALVMNFIIRAY